MAIGLYYTMEFTNVEGTFVKVLIGDNSVQIVGTPQIVPLDPAGDPLRISTIDNQENKFSPLKGQQAVIAFHSNDQTNLETFADGADDRYPVTVLYGTSIIFYGFLSLADNQEAFLPPKNTVILTAKDKLTALQEIPLTDADGENPEGKYKIGQIVAMCLQKTGLSLPLRVINNLRHGTGVKSFLAAFGEPEAPFVLTENVNASFFYVGQRVQITGTASNNVEFTVVSVSTGFVGVIGATVDFTVEAAIMTTFTDVTTSDHFYTFYLDIKTFEAEIGVSENCDEVLTKILGYDCFLIQYKECWWICRVDEYENNPFYVARFDENGDFIDIYEETNLLKSFGKGETHWFEGEATIVLPTRPIRKAKLTYNFNNPAEVVCNQDFERGDEIDAPDLSAPSSTGTYELNCWTLRRLAGSITSTIFIERKFEYGYEKERYMVMTPATSTATPWDFAQSMPIPIQQKDKLDFSGDYRFDTNYGGGEGNATYHPFLIYIEGEDGKFYYWTDFSSPGEYFWHESVTEGNFYTSDSFIMDTTDESEGRTVSLSIDPAPVSGKLYIGLIQLHQGEDSGDNQRGIFSNVTVNIKAFINGSYAQYRGRYEKVERTDDGYLAKIEDEVFISDSERDLFKGTIFFLADTVYKRTVKWYNAARYSLGNPTDLSVVKPFGQLQVYAVWNQYRLSDRVFQVQAQGFGEDIPSLVHKYSITDASPHSLNRNFLMLTCEKDLFLCNMTGTIEQVYHTTEGKNYDDPHEFKYIS